MKNRNHWIVALLLVFLISGTGKCRAQYGYYVRGSYIGPGSTVQGDRARGLGVFYDGAGRFVLNSSMARSIDNDTWIRLNEYLYLSLKQYYLERAERIAKRRELVNRAYLEEQRRLRERPDDSDLFDGAALNVILYDLANPQISPSSLRSVPVALPGMAMNVIPFKYAPMKGVISMRLYKLKENGHVWPLLLRYDDFAVERRAYHGAMQTILEQAVTTGVTPEAVNAVQQAVAILQSKAGKKLANVGERGKFEAMEFLKTLDDASRMLEINLVEAVVKDIEGYPGTTVADLVEFMRRYQLRFDKAEVPAERDAYRELLPLLVQQRDSLVKKVQIVREVLDKEKEALANEREMENDLKRFKEKIVRQGGVK